MLPFAINKGTKEDGMDRPASFVVCGLYTEYADFIYHPLNDKASSADSARNEAYNGQMMLLQEAWDIVKSPEAGKAIYKEMLPFKEQRRGYRQTWDGPTERCINDARVEADIFEAILLARVKFQYSNFPSTPDQGIAYRVAARDKPPQRPSTPSAASTPSTPSPPQSPRSLKRKRADSFLEESSELETTIAAPTAPRRKRARVLHNCNGEDLNLRYEAEHPSGN